MGVYNLWPLLPCKSIDCSKADGVLEVAKAMDGKRFAVDVAIWIMEAQAQPALLEAFHGDLMTVTVKLVFERICAFLRFGATPVLVLDGRTSQAKAGRLGQRYTAQTGIQLTSEIRVSSSAVSHNPIIARVRALAEALGVPVVQAAGEAEATCAALNAKGLVDGVQSKDVDSLLFGAQRVYKQLRLNPQNHRLCEVLVCDMEHVRETLGIQTGGALALQVMGVLAGGDFNIDGVENVGTGKALDTVRGLLARQPNATNDSGIGSALISALEQGPDRRLLELKHCTGCKTCGASDGTGCVSAGHESGCKSRKASHGRGGCSACGTESGCLPNPNPGQCMCEFHRLKLERYLSKVVDKACRVPGVVDSLHAALDEYTRQCQAASQAVQHLTRKDLGWQRRPDCQALVNLMTQFTHLEWQPNIIRLKLRPVLIEWDLLQGPTGGAGVEWRPTAIQKVQGLASKDASTSWQVLLHLERLPGVGSAQEEEEDREWLTGIIPRQQAQQATVDAEDAGSGSQAGLVGSSNATQGIDREGEEDEDGAGVWLATQASMQATQGAAAPLGNRKVGKFAPPDQRTFRISVVSRHWPAVARAFFEAQAAKNQPKPKAAARKPASKDAEALPRSKSLQKASLSQARTPRNKAAPSTSQPTIHQFLRTQKNPINATPAMPSQQHESCHETHAVGTGPGCSDANARTSAHVGSLGDMPEVATPIRQAPHQGCKSSGASSQQQQEGKRATKFLGGLDGMLAARRLRVAQQQQQSQQQQQQQQWCPQPLATAHERVTGPVVDLCTPSPPPRPQSKAHGNPLQGQPEQDVIDLCSDSDQDDGVQERQSPTVRAAASGVQSPAKRLAPAGLASPSKRKSHIEEQAV